jgi:hypothetical protein
MLALKYLLLILGVGLFSSSGILVAYDIYIAARLRWLLNARGTNARNCEFRRGGTSKAASQERRPIPLRVARTASLEEQP